MIATNETTSRTMFLASLAGILPILLWMAWELRYLFIPYLFLHFLSGPLAIRLQDASAYKRWCCGFVVTILLSAIKTSALLSTDASLKQKMLLYVGSALWECSNGVLVFGGRPLLTQYGIDGIEKALVVVLSPASVKFVKEPLTLHSWLSRSVHLAWFFVEYVALRVVFSLFASTLESHANLEAEALVLLLSCILMIWDLPSHFWQLIMLPYPVQVIYPYGKVYASTSMRNFWSKWSRPASQLVRYAIYYPLGGSECFYFSIPLLFMLNATSHYDVSNALVGDRAELGWNIVFGVLGLATLLEMLGNRIIGESCSTVYRVARALAAHVALLIAAYTLVHRVLHMSLSSFL